MNVWIQYIFLRFLPPYFFAYRVFLPLFSCIKGGQKTPVSTVYLFFLTRSYKRGSTIITKLNSKLVQTFIVRTRFPCSRYRVADTSCPHSGLRPSVGRKFPLIIEVWGINILTTNNHHIVIRALGAGAALAAPIIVKSANYDDGMWWMAHQYNVPCRTSNVLLPTALHTVNNIKLGISIPD